MEYIGNRPNPNPTNPNPYQYDDGNWWNWNPYGNTGGYDPYGASVTSWQDQILQPVGGGQPEVDANGNPIFRAEGVGTAPPVETTGSDIGQLDPGLAEYLASLSGGGTANFNVTGTDFMDPSYPFPGEYPVESYDPNPPLGNPTFTAEGTYKPPPDIVGWPQFEFNPNPPPSDPVFRTEVTGFPDPTYPFPGKYPWEGFTPNPPPGETEEQKKKRKELEITLTTPDRTKPTQPQPQQPGGKQQQQQPGVGKLLAALPMLAAFQGGTTTTPAPYAHLGPHTPVKPVFGPQAPGKRIPSIGQLLAGVR